MLYHILFYDTINTEDNILTYRNGVKFLLIVLEILMIYWFIRILQVATYQRYENKDQRQRQLSNDKIESIDGVDVIIRQPLTVANTEHKKTE